MSPDQKIIELPSSSMSSNSSILFAVDDSFKAYLTSEAFQHTKRLYQSIALIIGSKMPAGFRGSIVSLDGEVSADADCIVGVVFEPFLLGTKFFWWFGVDVWEF